MAFHSPEEHSPESTNPDANLPRPALSAVKISAPIFARVINASAILARPAESAERTPFESIAVDMRPSAPNTFVQDPAEMPFATQIVELSNCTPTWPRKSGTAVARSASVNQAFVPSPKTFCVRLSQAASCPGVNVRGCESPPNPMTEFPTVVSGAFSPSLSRTFNARSKARAFCWFSMVCRSRARSCVFAGNSPFSSYTVV